MVAAPAGDRFQALDALRAICALCVAAFHYRAVGQGGFGLFIANSWLFVDFFFVLSGFVIAASYGQRLAAGFRAIDFMWLRLGRVYPLHAVVLVAMVVVELSVLLLDQKGLVAREPFTGQRSIGALFGSFGMIHIFGLWPTLVWNGPSWTIAAELWAYGIFAIACRFGGTRYLWIMGGLASVSAMSLALSGEPWLDRTYSMALARCLFGFGFGVVAYRFHVSGRLRPGSAKIANLAEVITIALCVAFVSLAGGGPLALAAPFLFLLAVLIFSYEKGSLSRLLRIRVLQWLGMLSYSIYMIHAFLLGRLSDVYQLAQARLGVNLLGKCAYRAGVDCFATGGVLGVFTFALYLVLLILGSWISWRLIEEPARGWSRRKVHGAAARRAAELRDKHAAF